MIFHNNTACFEHSIFLKVIALVSSQGTSLKAPASPGIRLGPDSDCPKAVPSVLIRTSTTSFLTATTLIYAIGAGITAAAGTRLALQLLLVKWFKLYSFQLQWPNGLALLFLVTTSLCQDWVICAPAAFLGCGSHFSGSLSGIEP